MSVNKVIIVGHIGKDPEIRHLASGDAVANFSLATSESWKDKNTGEKKEATEWHRCNAFGKLAEIIEKYVFKGSQLYIEGSLKTRKWQDKDGQDRYTTEIRVDQLKMLGKPEGERQAPADGGEYAKASGREAAKPDAGGFGDMDDGIPFMRIGRVAAMLA